MMNTDNPGQAHPAGNIKKTSLAMSLAIGLGGIATQPMAALSTSTLNFTLGTSQVVACTYGTTPPCTKAAYNITDIVGSYFSMDTGGDGIVQPSEKAPIGSFNGIVMGTAQAASGSHSGPIDGTESPNIDSPWTFFGNTGMHQTKSPVTDNGNGTLDMSGWNVTWNGIASIPLVTTSPSTITCDPAACSSTDSYTIDGAFHVAGAGFTTVAYTVHLEGTVLGGGVPPLTQPDMANTIVGNIINLDVLANDNSADGLDTSSVAIDMPPTIGAATPRPDGIIDYDPQAATAGDTGAFTYTVDSLLGIPSSPTDVDVMIESNVNPVANDDSVAIETVAFENAGGQLEIDVLTNDTDANNAPGLPGGIDVTTVNILTQPSTGTCTADPDTGKVIYSQALPAVEVSTSCTYEVMDIDNFAGGAGPLTSKVATVDIDITSLGSDWPIALDPDIIPFLIFEDGVPNASGNTADIPESGTYFSMDVSAATTIYTTLTKGTDGGFIIGYDQLAFGSHTGLPTGNEFSSVDRGWNFFGNTGLTFTKNGGIVGNPDGTLKFSGTPAVNGGQGKYQITWNGIPEIDLGGSDQFPEDLGFALIECTPAPCTDGSTFDLNYEAHVAPGNPSGFGGVQYGLVMNGEVKFLDGAFQTSSGIFSVEDRLSANEVPPDPDSETQCAGGCFDYTITGVTDPSVSVILPLNGGVPNGTPGGSPQMRVFRDGAWGDFDANGSDSVLSAPFTEGGPFGTTCPPPGDATYVTLTEGHQCLQVTIADNGPNDKDPVVGTIMDPSGLAVIGPPLNLPPDCSAATASPSKIWPPNHKLVPVAITGVTDPDGDAVTVTVDSVSQDEAVNAKGHGAGNTTPDATLYPLAVRAERNGNKKTPGDGRVYHIDFSAVDENGNVCAGSTTVCVPHDKGGSSTCVDGGPLYDSTDP